MLALLLLPFLQDPAPASAPDPVRVEWDALWKAYLAAPALRLRAAVEIVDPAAEESEALTVRLAIQAELMRPCAGRFLLDGFAQAPGEEPDPIRELYHADGERLFLLDEEARRATFQGEAWNSCDAMFFLGPLGDAWPGDPVEWKDLALLPPTAEREGWTGFATTVEDPYGEAQRAETWFDAERRLRTLKLPIGGTAAFVVTFESLETIAEPTAKPFLHAVPDGYEVIVPDRGEGLLDVGAEAPEVRFIGMDDVEFSLSSLRGKTVLLNFWFFH